MMWLLLVVVYTFGLVNCHSNFLRMKYPDLFEPAKFRMSGDYTTAKQFNVSSTVPNFQNPKAQEFFVNGTTIPDVDFDVGPSWAGLLPISNITNESRQLFFWYFPSQTEEGINDLVIWLNGGPGCSSLEGFLQENGPISWQTGTHHPVPNPDAWNTLANVLWIEQPVGTGFSQGEPNIRNETELAEQFYGFLTQYFDIFTELKNSSVYLTGESYAGYYVPYIANYIYELPNTTSLKINLQGILIFDPYMGDDLLHSQIPAVPFVHINQNIFNLNASFLSDLNEKNKKCGFENYSQLHITYPPKDSLPILPSIANTLECDLWFAVFQAALMINPAFNIYRITDTPPILWSVLGFPGTFPDQQSPIYFARSDVQEAIHAPNISWILCAEEDVFLGGIDRSEPPAYSILPNVIEKSQRSIIVNGQHDFIIMAEGVRAIIQNMTWNGLRGFQIKPEARFIVPEQGDMGFTHTERGLTYVELVLCGHMVPGFQPKASLQILKYLLGRIDRLANETSTTTSMAVLPISFSLLHFFALVVIFYV